MESDTSTFQKFPQNIYSFSDNIYNNEQENEEERVKRQKYQSLVHKGVSDEVDEREHANGTKSRQEERDERHTEKKGQGKKVREPADSNYHTADNTPHSLLRHSTSSTMN